MSFFGDNFKKYINFASRLTKLTKIHQDLEGTADQLPEIVVIGDQSSGKSSLLEFLIGHWLLPSAAGCVTRRPLRIRLHRVEDSPDTYATFDCLTDDVKLQLHQIYEEIERQTSDCKVKNPDFPAKSHDEWLADIREEVINLHIYGPDLPNLTLVDLPGVTRNREKDQVHDFVEKTKNLARRFCKRENVIVMAVCDSRNDLANAAAPEIALEFDKEKRRTVGVFTKIDLLEQPRQQLLIDSLNDKSKTLGIPFVGIANKTVDLMAAAGKLDNSKKTEYIKKGHRAEKEWFETRVWPLNQKNVGRDFLNAKLGDQLMERIKCVVPIIVTKLDERLQKLYPQYIELRTVGQNEEYFLQAMGKCIDILKRVVDNPVLARTQFADAELAERIIEMSKRLNKILYKSLPDDIDRVASSEEAKRQAGGIRTMMAENQQTLGPHIQGPQEIVTEHVNKNIQDLKVPVEVNIANQMKEQMTETIKIAMVPFESLEFLKPEIEKALTDVLNTKHELTKNQITHYFKQQEFNINMTGYKNLLKNLAPLFPQENKKKVQTDDDIVELADKMTTLYTGLLKDQVARILARYMIGEFVEDAEKAVRKRLEELKQDEKYQTDAERGTVDWNKLLKIGNDETRKAIEDEYTELEKALQDISNLQLDGSVGENGGKDEVTSNESSDEVDPDEQSNETSDGES